MHNSQKAPVSGPPFTEYYPFGMVSVAWSSGTVGKDKKRVLTTNISVGLGGGPWAFPSFNVGEVKPLF